MSAEGGPKQLGLDASFAAEGFELLAEEALCSLCTDYLDDAVETDCPARHVYCSPCLQKVLDHRQTCPDCRGAVTKMEPAHFRVRSMIERVRWKCLNFKNGCQFIGTKKELEKHLDVCEETESICPFEGCGEKGGRAHIVEHRKGCPFQTVPCDHCTEMVSFQAMEKHLSVCPKLPVPCPRECGRKPPRGEVAFHLETECEEEEVVCEVPGCRERMKRKNLEEHEEANMRKHMKLLCARVLSNEKTRTGENEEPGKDVQRFQIVLPGYLAKASGMEKGESLKSRTFTFQGHRFCTCLYPKGQAGAQEGQASLFLCSLEDYRAEVSLSLLVSNLEMEAVGSSLDFSRGEYGLGAGWLNFCSSQALLEAARRTTSEEIQGGALEIWVCVSAPAVNCQPLLVRGYGANR
uniref:RING-type domain-containing protein n=1 Tax=Chromera velia CCMP2878 TaxID=1169474 RepID=A0A0G4FR05_9ALVE|eukprot:Cvel_18302.t1-p1 / transcript=Cvel_18302.t1 / gene=Cvel_18302 / organism=Chromera_velia_CCMP2878 / gene_product=TNF receptor-associated factor 2, putative / transcript_product=TNF receptor-associated factor 2, putative / location=Cvel_scaffold1509:20646-23037(+) / protein_length=405 / sequence_SO=supercontig / SO=protein_coding / is_pseudo=false